MRVWDVVEVDYHIAGRFQKVGFFAAAEDSSGRYVVEVVSFVLASGLVVGDGAQVFRVGLGVVADKVFEDVFRGGFPTGACVAYRVTIEAESWARWNLRSYIVRVLFFFRLVGQRSWLANKESLGQSCNQLLLREILSTFVIVCRCKRDGITVKHLSVWIVETSLVKGKFLFFYGNTVYRDVDDATVRPYRVGTFSAVLT